MQLRADWRTSTPRRGSLRWARRWTILTCNRSTESFGFPTPSGGGQTTEGRIDARFRTAMQAAWHGKVRRFESILDQTPALVSARSSCSHPTLLQFVVLDGSEGKIKEPQPFLRALIDRGAPLDEPLVAAASVGARGAAADLLAAGASVEACSPWTPLEEALYWPHVEFAAYLRNDHNANVLSLRAAAGLGNADLVEGFLANGGPTDAAGPVRFPWGTLSADSRDVVNQALVVAAKNGQRQIVERLVDIGAEVNAFPPGIHEHGAALHLSAMLGRTDVVRSLLALGADPSLVDPEHRSTPAGWAEHGAHRTLARELRALEDPEV